jgi:hypothetical protein
MGLLIKIGLDWIGLDTQMVAFVLGSYEVFYATDFTFFFFLILSSSFWVGWVFLFYISKEEHGAFLLYFFWTLYRHF